MPRFHHLPAAALLALTATVSGAQTVPVTGYPATFPAVPLDDADQLAVELRTLAADPLNLYALINAGRLSLKVGDTDGAAALYTRAERVAPGNPQVKAGMARLLVNAQRPGEALRLFQDAAAAGAGLRDFGPDRALAYDLVGEQERAQREYRALLRLGADDETTRRYALSLGIAGRTEPALALLEPLNRRGDRGAWRARAFVLAMNGDRAEAERIAATMMPPGMAEGLKPFFDRLPGLSETGRAFAVHFGEVRSNAARVADARRAPALAALAPEPDPFPPRAAVQLAATDRGKKGRRDKRAAQPVRVAAEPAVAPLPLPPVPTTAQLAALGSNGTPPPGFMARASTRGVTVLPPPADAYRSRDTRLAVATPPRLPATTGNDGDGAGDEPDATAPTNPAMPLPARADAAAPTVVRITEVSAPAAAPPGAPVVVAAAPVPSIGDNALTAGATLPPALADTNAGVATVPVAVSPPPSTASGGDVVFASIAARTEAPAPATATASPAPIGTAKLLTTVERKIETRAAVRDAKVAAGPLAKLPRKDRRGRFIDAAGKPLLDRRGRPLDAKAAAAWQVDQLAKADAADAADDTFVVKLPPRDKRGRFLDAKGQPLLDRRGRPLDAKAAAAWQLAHADDRADEGGTTAAARLPRKDRRGRFLDADGKPLLDKRGRPLDAKAAAAWQLAQADDAAPKGRIATRLPPKDRRGRYLDADGKPLLDRRGRPLDARAAAAWLLAEGRADVKKKPDPAKAEPGRIWVQVAGGANEATLGKAWAKVSGETPALRGRQGWTTPLKATNRVLTGPFKTSAEAMALVNKLKGQGVSAFMFTSDPGQKVARLGTK